QKKSLRAMLAGRREAKEKLDMSSISESKKSVKHGDDEPRWDWRRSVASIRRKAYHLPSVTIDPDAKLTPRCRRHADAIFRRLRLPGYKQDQKRMHCHHLTAAGHHAVWAGGAVRYPRGLHEASKAQLQVIDAAVDAGEFHGIRSKKGSPKMSRLIPSMRFAGQSTGDPWDFDAGRPQTYVFVRDRKTKEDLPLDPDHPVAAEYQRKLAQLNEVNARWEITYTPYDEDEEDFADLRRRLRPVHVARFNSSDFDLGGRIYTGRYGHQGLRKMERA